MTAKAHRRCFHAHGLGPACVAMLLGLSSLIVTGTDDVWAVTSSPTSDTEARRHYDAGQAAYREGRYDAAARAFKAAFSLVNEAALLHNLARSLEKAGHLDAALERFHELLRHPSLGEQLRQRGGQDIQRVLQAVNQQRATRQRIAREVTIRSAVATLREGLATTGLPTSQPHQDKLRRAVDSLRADWQALQAQREQLAVELIAEEAKRRTRLERIVASIEDLTAHAPQDKRARLSAQRDAVMTERRVLIARLRRELTGVQEAIATSAKSYEALREGQVRAQAQKVGRRLAQLQAQERELMLKVMVYEGAQLDDVTVLRDEGPIATLPTPLFPELGRQTTDTLWGWVCVGGAGALFLTSAILWLQADSRQDEITQGLNTRAEDDVVTGITQRRAHMLSDEADLMNSLGWGGLGLGVTALSAGLVLLLEDERAVDSGVTLHIAPSLGSQGRIMLQAQGRF